VTQEDVSKIIEIVQGNSDLISSLPYILTAILSGIVIIIISYFRGYGREKGKFQAIEENLDSIKGQLSETTQITEEIKSNIAHQSWKQKDRETLKREKLEQYMLLMISLTKIIHKEVSHKLIKNETAFDELAWDTASMIQSLYLPELNKSHLAMLNAHNKYLEWLHIGLKEISDATNQGGVNPIASAEHMNKYSEIIINFNAPLAILTREAEILAESINT